LTFAGRAVKTQGNGHHRKDHKKKNNLWGGGGDNRTQFLRRLQPLEKENELKNQKNKKGKGGEGGLRLRKEIARRLKPYKQATVVGSE